MREVKWQKYVLKFKSPGGTSRGVLHIKESYFLKLEVNGKSGFGECGILRGLSADDRPDYEDKLNWLSKNLHLSNADIYENLREYPSIQFGWEQALREIDSESHVIFPSEFTSGKACQPINGLIWMGDAAYMKHQIRERLKNGFRVLKMKIGAIGIKEELDILKKIRKEHKPEELELRVDANGAFSLIEAKEILKELAELNIHSIEQPIKAGNWQEMAKICENSAIPVALDEELIGIFDRDEKKSLLQTIKPAYVILKPNFIGGFKGSEEWMNLAESEGIKWWVTSALESNLGLSAIAQWNYVQKNPIASGLGTGSLYINNFRSPLRVKNGKLCYLPSEQWDLSSLKEKAP